MSIGGNFISITDIRQDATRCIDELGKTGDKIIFKNNKPQAVLVEFGRYEKMLAKSESQVEALTGSEEVIGTSEHDLLLSLMRAA